MITTDKLQEIKCKLIARKNELDNLQNKSVSDDDTELIIDMMAASLTKAWTDVTIAMLDFGDPENVLSRLKNIRSALNAATTFSIDAPYERYYGRAIQQSWWMVDNIYQELKGVEKINEST